MTDATAPLTDPPAAAPFVLDAESVAGLERLIAARAMYIVKHSPPWWWPDQRGGALIGLFLLTGYILRVTAPAVGAEPSEFFKAVAQAVVLTGFLAAIGFLFQSSKGTADANARADRTLDLASKGSSAP